MPQSPTPKRGVPVVLQQPSVAGTITSPHPLPGVPPFQPTQSVAPPVNMGGNMPPYIPPTAQINLPSPQAQQWNQAPQEEVPPKKWGTLIAVIAIIALFLAIVLMVVSKDSDSSKSASTKLPKVGQGSAVDKPTIEVAPLAAVQAQPAEQAPAVVATPPEEPAAVEDVVVAADPCAECAAAQNEEPEVEPLTLEGLAEDLDEHKKSQRGQWTAIGKLNKQMKEVQIDIATIRLDVNEIKKMDQMKVSDLPGVPAASTEKVEAAKPEPVTVKIRTVDHPGPPPATPRSPKVTRK